MKFKSCIAILILAVYSIVLAHSFIPHHHHSEFSPETQACQVNNQHEQHNHHDQNVSSCCVDHSHNEQNQQDHCSFNEKIILQKSIDLSVCYFPSIKIEFADIEKSTQAIVEGFIPLQILDPHCRDVQLRGPPLFS